MEHRLSFLEQGRRWELRILGVVDCDISDLNLDVQPLEIRLTSAVLPELCVCLPPHARLDPEHCKVRLRSREGVLVMSWPPIHGVEHVVRDCIVERVNSSPLIYECRNFITAAEGSAIVQATQRCSEVAWLEETSGAYNLPLQPLRQGDLTADQRSLLESVYARIDALCGVQRHPKEQLPRVHNMKPQPGEASERMPIGLHLDVNGRPWRYATAILYLTSLPDESDGATVFPCVGDVAAQEVAEELHRNYVVHTITLADPDMKPVAQQLTNVADEKRGLSVHPEAGKLVIFFSRHGDGSVDHFSWHGGARVNKREGCGDGKWILQFFKEIPVEHRRGTEAVARFVSDRQVLPEFTMHGIRHRLVVS